MLSTWSTAEAHRPSFAAANDYFGSMSNYFAAEEATPTLEPDGVKREKISSKVSPSGSLKT